jgi:hypothetical protein
LITTQEKKKPADTGLRDAWGELFRSSRAPEEADARGDYTVPDDLPKADIANIALQIAFSRPFSCCGNVAPWRQSR